MRTVRHRLAVVLLTLAVLDLLPVRAAVASASGVEHARRELRQLGCRPGPADGRVADRTRAAVIRFQSANRLRQSGRLTPGTRRRLEAASARRCDVRPVPARSGRGRRIVLSQRQNHLWLLDRRGRVVAQGPMVDNPKVLSPGRYAVGPRCGRAARIRRNTDGGGLWLDDFVRFAPCGIGFHRIPRRMSTGRQIHPDWLLGTDLRVSHGCVRLDKALARRIWRFTARPTRVRVVGG